MPSDKGGRIRAIVYEWSNAREMITMSDSRRGLPLTKSHSDKIFPKLTPAQISRIAIHGRIQSGQPD